MIDVPSFRLSKNNVFNFRTREWSNNLVENIEIMLRAGEPYGLRVSSISINDKEKIDYSEIKRTISKILKISLSYQNGEEAENFDISYEIPWLINNHFFIGGNYKVCVYQLFDKPIVVRKNLIKIRTNIHSFTVEKNERTKKKYNFIFHLFGKKIPFAKAVIAFYGVSETRKKFELNKDNEYIGKEPRCENIFNLISDIISVLNDASLDKVRLFGSEFPKKTDQNILEDIDLVSKIDIFNFKFFKTSSIIEEFLYVLENNLSENLHYDNKRLRFVEQIIYVHLCKDFYNMIMCLRKNRKVKFSVNSKSILSNVNVSNIVQFDSSLNPLAELSLFLRTSLSGPGGFEKSNVPQYLREIHPSMMNILDPADTADRDGCGTTQYLLPNINIENCGEMVKQNNKIVNSVAISFVPFLEHDDATRLQMSSSQQRHSIMLKNFDNALIQSGIEGMYSDQSSFLFQAERDGKVIYLDNEMIVIQYDNKICKAFHIGYKKLYLSVADFYKVYFKCGDIFKKGDIIAESNYMKNGRIALGKNILTAVMVYHGYNYEDGIIISDKLVKNDTFTSIHYMDLSFDLTPNKVLLNLNSDYENYKPLPNLYEKLKVGDIYAKIKSVSSEGFDDVIFEPVSEEIVEEDCVITDIKIYANKWNTSFPQYDNFIKQMILNQKKTKKDIIDTLSKYLTKDELEKYLVYLEINKSEKNKTNYKIKGENVDGIRIEMTAMYERKISIGDKIGNRHGNKGVISAIIPEDQMPVLEDGRRVEVIINPLGIVSRMNIGQLFELHLAMSLMDLKKKIVELYNEKKSIKEIYSYILEYIKIIDKTEDHNYTKQMEQFFENVCIKDFMKNLHNFFVIQPPFESIKIEDLQKAMKYTNTEFEYNIFDPVSNKKIENQIAVGYQYFLKLNHIAKDKISYRGIGPYSAKTSQPLGGKSRKGGQRIGEMEMWAIIAHGAEKNLNEFISVKSDSIKMRNKYISDKIGNSELLLDSDDDAVSQSLRLLQTNLKALGLDFHLHDNDQKIVRSIPVLEKKEPIKDLSELKLPEENG